jgi:hypothetical protein
MCGSFARGVRTIKSADLFDLWVHICMKHQCLDVRIRGCRENKFVYSTRYENLQLQIYTCMKRFLPAEFGGLNIPSLELDAEPANYASFIATLANLITDYEFESLGPECTS